MVGPTLVTGIRHVLFDADGVLQHVPGGWESAASPYLGKRAMEFLRRAWADELPALSGEADFLPLLAAALIDFGVSEPVTTFHRDVWHNIAIVDSTVDVVHALRQGGYGVHLGTNQDRHRAGHMRAALGYDDLFDVSCYSFELGVAKPDPAFFAEAARRIGAPPAQILFIDDSVANVDGARSAGLAAEQWTHGSGQPSLIALLARHGIELPEPSARATRDGPARSAEGNAPLRQNPPAESPSAG